MKANVYFDRAFYTPKFSFKKAFILELIFHLIVVAGIALAATGGAKLASATSSSDYTSDTRHLKIGYLILFLSVLLLVVFALYILLRLPHARLSDQHQQYNLQYYGEQPNSQQPHNPQNYSQQQHYNQQAHGIINVNGKVLVLWTMVAILFTAIRVVYGLVYAFSSDKQKLSPVTADFTIKFIFIFLVQFIAAACLLIGGIWSRSKYSTSH
jgi:hypothetical protein